MVHIENKYHAIDLRIANGKLIQFDIVKFAQKYSNIIVLKLIPTLWTALK